MGLGLGVHGDGVRVGAGAGAEVEKPRCQKGVNCKILSWVAHLFYRCGNPVAHLFLGCLIYTSVLTTSLHHGLI